MFWKKVVIIISYLLSAKRNLKMSSPTSRFRFEKEPLQVKEQNTCKKEILQIQKLIRIRRRKLWR